MSATLARPRQWQAIDELPTENRLYVVRFETGAQIYVEYRDGWKFDEASSANPIARNIIEHERTICWSADW